MSSGEVMHSVSAPSDEANKLYVEQSFSPLAFLKREAQADELVIWDVDSGRPQRRAAQRSTRSDRLERPVVEV